VLDRRHRHRQVPPPHRPGHGCRRDRPPGPLHAGLQTRNELVEAADDKQLSKTIARYRLDLLCLDELSYLELDRRGAELLFQVLTKREERSAIAIASDEPFSGWTKTFTDPRLCAAIVDRLTFAGQIIETATTSYRLAHARQRRAG
jgi:DNA replication protein DnaC